MMQEMKRFALGSSGEMCSLLTKSSHLKMTQKNELTLDSLSFIRKANLHCPFHTWADNPDLDYALDYPRLS